MRKEILFIILSLFPSLAFAFFNCSQSIVPCDLGECTLCDFFQLLYNIVNYLLWCLIPPLAVLMIVVGGLLYVASILEFLPGGPETVSKAKRIFTSIALGLFVAYAAWALIALFLKALGYTKGNWFEIEC
jgi:hypothetical protein